MSELQRHFSFRELYHFRKMAAVRNPPDDMENTRLWLFEYLCHALLSEGNEQGAGFAKLHPCFADNTGDNLLLEHVFQAHHVRSLDVNLPPVIEPGSYFIVASLRDATLFTGISHPVLEEDTRRRGASTHSRRRPVYS